MKLRRLCAVFLVLLLAIPMGSFAEQVYVTDVTLYTSTGEFDEYGQPVYMPVDMAAYPYEIVTDEFGNISIRSNALDGMPVRIVVNVFDQATEMSKNYVSYDPMTGQETVFFNGTENIPLYQWREEGVPIEEQSEVILPVTISMARQTVEEPPPQQNNGDQDEGGGYVNEDYNEEPPPTPQVLPEDRETDVAEVIAPEGSLFLLSLQDTQGQVLPQGTRFKYEVMEPVYTEYSPDGIKRLIPVVLSTGQRGFVEMNDQAIRFVDTTTAAQYETSLFTSGHADIGAQGAPLVDASGQQIGFLNAGQTVQYLSGADSVRYMNRQLWIKVQTYPDRKEGYIQANLATFKTAAEENNYLESLKQQVTVPSDTNSLRPSGAEATLYREDLTTPIRTVLANEKMTFSNATAFRYDANYKAYGFVFIDATGETGYVKMDDVQFYTPEPEPDPEPEDNQTSPPPVVEPDRSRLAYMQNGRDINIRDSIDGNPGRQVDEGDAVLVIQTRQDSGGNTWYYVEVLKSANHPDAVGYKGYVRYATPNDVLRFMTPEEETAFRASQVTSEPPTDPKTDPPTDPKTDPPTDPKTDEPSSNVSSRPPLTQVKGYMRVTAPQYADLNVFPMVGAARLAVLSYNEVVYVDGQVYDDAGNVWCITQPLYEGAPSGYVLTSNLVAMTPTEVNNFFATPRPTPTAIQTYSPNAFSGYAVLTKNRVNFRTTPNGSAMTQLNQGTVVRIIDSTTADGYTWYQCESGGRIGYLRGDMLSLMTIAQYMQYVSNPSYNQNGNIITPTATINVSGTNAPVWATPRPGASSTITFVTIPPLSTASPNPSGSVDPSASISPDPSATASDGGVIGGISPSPSLDPDATLPPPPDVDPTFDTQESGGFSPPGLLLAIIILLVLAGGGFYGYSVYNKTRRKQAEEQAKLATAAKAKQQGNGVGEKPAVRRPVPPTQPNRPAGPGGTVAGQPARPGTPPSGTANTAKPGTPGAPNPYARPQSQQPPRTQEVTSSMPRAQVDGKPVGDGKTPQGNPYARPQTQQTPPPNQKQAPGTAPRTRMPIAPPPVEPDADARNPQSEGTGEGETAPRRRRRRYTEDGDKTE